MNTRPTDSQTVRSTSTILVVDDNPAALKGTARVLTQAGYRVAIASDGTEALRQVRAIHPTLVLLDVVLPDLEGTEVVRRIRADPDLAGTTLVLLSAQQISPEQQAFGLDIGADGYIARPIANTELVARVRMHLRHNDLKQLTHSLHESEERFRMLLQSVPTVAIQGYGVDGTVQYWNDASERFYGYSREEALGRNLLDLIIPPEIRDEVAEAFRGVAEEQRDIPNGELNLMRKDGSHITVFSSHAVLRRTGHPPELFCIDVDLSERDRVERELARTNRSLRMLSRCNEALLRSETENELLASICQTVVDLGGFRMAWVGYASDDQNKTIVPQAHQGAEDGYLSKIKISWDENLLTGRGPAGRAIRSGELVIISDLATDEGFRPWLSEAQARGFKAVINLPLKDGTHTFGVLGMHKDETGEPLPDEMRVLRELANNLAFGISALRGRAEQRLAQQKIAEQAALLDKAQDAILVRDLEHRIIYWNQSAERLYGWTAREALGQSAKELLYRDPTDFIVGTDATLRTGEWAGELRQKPRAAAI